MSIHHPRTTPRSWPRRWRPRVLLGVAYLALGACVAFGFAKAAETGFAARLFAPFASTIFWPAGMRDMNSPCRPVVGTSDIVAIRNAMRWEQVDYEVMTATFADVKGEDRELCYITHDSTPIRIPSWVRRPTTRDPFACTRGYGWPCTVLVRAAWPHLPEVGQPGDLFNSRLMTISHDVPPRWSASQTVYLPGAFGSSVAWALILWCTTAAPYLGFKSLRRRRRRRSNRCIHCSYSLVGVAAGVCPECGSNWR